MSYGLETYTASGSLSFSSDTQAIGIYDVFSAAAGATGSKSYPELAGSVIQMQTVLGDYYTHSFFNLLAYNFSISYSSGYPIINWSMLHPSFASRYPIQHVYVLLISRPSSSYGFQTINGSAEIVNSEITSNYRYAGSASVISNSSILNGDYKLNCSITCSSIPVVFIENLEGQLSTVQSIKKTGNLYEIRIVKKGAAVPRVLCFDKTATIPSGHGIALFNSSGALLMASTDNLLAPKAYHNEVVPSTAISGVSAGFYLNATSGLSSVGTIPTSSASFITATTRFGGEVFYTGTFHEKEFFLSIKKQSGLFYTGWVIGNYYNNDVYQNPFYPILINADTLFRVYTIDTSQYP